MVALNPLISAYGAVVSVNTALYVNISFMHCAHSARSHSEIHVAHNNCTLNRFYAVRVAVLLYEVMTLSGERNACRPIAHGRFRIKPNLIERCSLSTFDCKSGEGLYTLERQLRSVVYQIMQPPPF